jgi:AcrR family transcriptional regulator
VALSGVSRRAFYEQFASKQDCFLTTYDTIATHAIEQINIACNNSTGNLRRRVTAAIRALVTKIATNTPAAYLTLVETQQVGPLGLSALRKTMSTYEQMLTNTFACRPEANPLPPPLAKSVIGGIHQAISLRLREGHTEELHNLTKDLTRWTLLFQAPAYPDFYTRMSERASLIPTPTRPTTPPAQTPETSTRETKHRERLLETVLQLAASTGYEELMVPMICETAEVPLESFLDMFATKDECFLEALDNLNEEILRTIASTTALVSRDWPNAVRHATNKLTRLLAAKPTYAQTITITAPNAGVEALARNHQLAHDITTLLTEGAPRKAHNRLHARRSFTRHTTKRPGHHHHLRTPVSS